MRVTNKVTFFIVILLESQQSNSQYNDPRPPTRSMPAGDLPSNGGSRRLPNSGLRLRNRRSYVLPNHRRIHPHDPTRHRHGPSRPTAGTVDSVPHHSCDSDGPNRGPASSIRRKNAAD